MFQKALNIIKTIFTTTGFFAPLLSLFGVTIPPVALSLAPVAVSLMTAAEDALGDGTGPLKKAAVTSGLVAFAGAMKEVSTGGQKETWNVITDESISTLIDTVATVANGISKTEVFDDSAYEQMKSDMGRG
jgi:hypothetical protein